MCNRSGARSHHPDRATGRTLEALIAIAVSRGCRHYAPMVGALHEVSDFDDPGLKELPHELLGCRLLAIHGDLAYSQDDWFSAFRVGAMVLSDLGNDPAEVVRLAIGLGICAPLHHLADLGRGYDPVGIALWEAIRLGLPARHSRPNEFTYPGISRLVTETYLDTSVRPPRIGSRLIRIWLRTDLRNHYSAVSV